MVSALLVLMIIGCCAFAHFNPHIKLVGTWTGDGTLDLLGDSPFDGAVELTFMERATAIRLSRVWKSVNVVFYDIKFLR